MLIGTEFDHPLEQDVNLEETEDTPGYSAALKNAENIMKSFLYLKKLMGGADPFVNKITKVQTIDTSVASTQYTLAAGTGKILFKNLSSSDNASLFINSGEFILFPYESIELPLSGTDVVETNGHFSVIETEYKMGKG